MPMNVTREKSATLAPHASLLIDNGETDRMVLTSNGVEMARCFPNSARVLYPHGRHGGIRLCRAEFAQRELAILAQ